MKTSEVPVIVEQIFNQPLEVVWKVITDKNEMIKWFFGNMPAFKAEVGFKTKFNVKAPSRDFLHLWEVVEVIPLKKIVVNWKYEECVGSSLVIMSLDSLGSETKLTVTTKVLEDFDDRIPEFKRESCLAGWNYFIKGNLKSFLEERE